MNENDTQQETFIPKGAIAFFLVMISFYLVLWLVFYFILLGRQ